MGLEGTERLGRFTILRHLASGGMADVLLARADGIEGFERHIVVKRILPEMAKDQRFIDMFLDEARVAAGLHHQNVVQVHDIGEANGEYFFTMEYLHGEDLRKILSTVSKTGTHMPLGYVVAIITSIAAGLHYAHERRSNDGRPLDIVHRDVSPSNILIGYDGSVKVLDFGIAKAAMRHTETKSGSLKGKVSYMSPEQCRGDAVDRRSDVYALGVILYELATTMRLFKHESEYIIMDAIVNGKVPPPCQRRPDLPEELSQIIMRALATNRDDRFQSAEQMRIALDQFAIRSNTMATTSALASYMKQLFGTKLEPWLDIGTATSIEAMGMPAARHSWTEMPRQTAEPQTAAHQDEARTTTDGKRRLAHELAASPAIPVISPRETRTSANFGFEQSQKTQPPTPKKSRRGLVAALVAVPMIAIGGIVAWKVTAKDAPPTPVTPAASEHVAVMVPTPGTPKEPTKVDVQLDADIANARVIYRRHVTPAPMKTTITASDIVELVELSAPGYKTQRYWLTFDRPTHLRAHMVKGTGVNEASEEDTLVALGEAAAPATPTPAQPVAVAAAAPTAPVAPAPRRKIGRGPDEQVAATTPVEAPRTTPVEPPRTEPVPTPEPVAVAPSPVTEPVKPAAPVPSPPKAEPPRMLAPAALRALLVASPAIDAPDSVQMEMERSNVKTAKATVKVCIGPAGDIQSASLMKSSGYSSYDDRVVAGVRAWKYRPYLDGGKAVAACSAVVFAIGK